MELNGVTVAVIGIGASGSAAARLAAEQGGDVYVSDSRTDEAATAHGALLGDAGISVELGRHDIERIAGADIVVASPGIPPDAPVLRALSERGVRWISEPELAARFLPGALIAITGTNGKTTTTLLVDHLLRASGIRSAAGGNVGGGLAPAASDLARFGDPYDWVVLEMSSFQLAAIDTFRPDIGVVTNLSPDHLDRYDTVEAYYADKARLFQNADDDSVWVLPHADEEVAALAGDAPGRRYTFGDAGSHAFVDGEELVVRPFGEIERLLPVRDLPLLGAHNVTNALAAALVARLAGAQSGGIAAGLGSARALPHRLEPIRDEGGVLWVNDSKATNVAATRSALRSLTRPVVLLLGGKDKGEDFAPLASAVREGVVHVLAYGAVAARAAGELRAAIRPGAPGRDGGPAPEIEVVEGSMDAVVSRAAEVARPGDVVLLSPACSSFDMYASYERRGEHFTELARRVA
jgi:UDP-N-acetylmuramoylalanine--D-glutamate ligase